jgi:hypothetical protein
MLIQLTYRSNLLGTVFFVFSTIPLAWSKDQNRQPYGHAICTILMLICVYWMFLTITRLNNRFRLASEYQTLMQTEVQLIL